jgi:hypothetical protein
MSEFSQIDFSDILSIDWPDDSYIKFIDQYKKTHLIHRFSLKLQW